MPAFEVRPADEGRHLAGTDELWGESWYHDFAAPDGSYGGYLRLGLYPNLGVAWCWLHLVRRREPLVLIRDHAAPCPTADGPLEIATDRFRMTWRCTEPLIAWRVTTEGTGVALTDPADAFHGEAGPEIPVRVDLEWRAAAPVFPYRAMTRYEQPAFVQGDVVIGDQRIEVRCPGERDHSWGVRDWWQFPWLWTAGRLDDGTWFHAVRTLVGELGDANFQTGFVIDPDLALHELARIGFTPSSTPTFSSSAAAWTSTASGSGSPPSCRPPCSSSPPTTVSRASPGRSAASRPPTAGSDAAGPS